LHYTRGTDLSGSQQGAGGIGGLLARADNCLLLTFASIPSAHAYYHADGNGNVTALINSRQLAVAKYRYDPFGNVLSHSGPLAATNAYRSSSKEAHQMSGLIYYLYRFYDSHLQRWQNHDPISELGFELLRARRPSKKTDSHLYQFVGNDPVSKWDVFGLDNPGCDVTGLPGGLPGATIECVLSCCAQHDKCFADHHCKAKSSWPAIICPFSRCGGCNRQVIGCLVGCMLGGNGPETQLYYCPNGPHKGEYYDNWDEIPPSCWEHGTKPDKAPPGWP
jgi:RHS repeat-associated protein